MTGRYPSVGKVSIIDEPHLSEAIKDCLTHLLRHTFGIQSCCEFTSSVGPTIQSFEADLASFLVPLVVGQLL